MRGIVLAFAAAAALGGCAATPSNNGNQVTGGTVALAAVGTPFLIAAKIPLCAITLVTAGPVGATAELVPPDDTLGADVRQGLADSIDENCGPPYIVQP